MFRPKISGFYVEFDVSQKYLDLQEDSAPYRAGRTETCATREPRASYGRGTQMRPVKRVVFGDLLGTL